LLAIAAIVLTVVFANNPDKKLVEALTSTRFERTSSSRA